MGLVKEWEAFGLLCRVLDGPFKNYNGYVALPKSHPYWGKDYNDIPIRVHGGLTFGGQGGGVAYLRPYVLGGKEKGKLDPMSWPDPNLWWIGFDTSHLGDFITYNNESHPDPCGVFWTIEMVERETEELAKQLSELTSSEFALKDDVK